MESVAKGEDTWINEEDRVEDKVGGIERVGKSEKYN